MLRFIGRTIRLAITAIILVALIPVAGLSYGFLTTSPVDTTPLAFDITEAPAPKLRNELTGKIANYQRTEESTWLTYPEWSIVYAAREYAHHVSDKRESSFPFWAYVGRYWKDYAIVIRATAQYPFNTANHVMLMVIGTSHTIEFGVQSIYENTIGRITEALSGAPVAEDLYQAETAAKYARFLDQTPWYRFNNKQYRRELWNIEPASGAAAIRSWERKLAFGLSYTIKQVYAWIIRKGLTASSDPALLDIHVWAAGPVKEAATPEKSVRILKDAGEDGAVFVTPRYQRFTNMVPRLVSRGMHFIEIGGNDLVMITVLSKNTLETPEGARHLFSYPLPARPEFQRTGMTVAVPRLHDVLPALQKSGASLEHLYDY